MPIHSKINKCSSVLVIEDNEGDFILLEDFLIEKYPNVNTTHCSDCDCAIDFLMKNKYSLVLLDLQLPDVSGLELIKKILSNCSNTPVIILTGYTDLGLAQESLQLGVYDYLIKDEINPTLLHKSIEFALSRRSFVQQIKEETLNYERLFNFSPKPTWLLDRQSLQILNANFSAIEKYGYSLESFKQMSFIDLHPTKEKKIVKKKIQALRKGK
ncbi:MAG: response regulator, partial [Psychroflexus sp.]